MGHRTVVILINDEAHNWQHDPDLGKKIFKTASGVGGSSRIGANSENYGIVVENVHADRQTLVVLDSYGATTLAEDNWRQNETDEQVQLKLLKEAAEKLGYDLTPKKVARTVYVNGVPRPNTDRIWLDYEKGIRQPGYEGFGLG